MKEDNERNNEGQKRIHSACMASNDPRLDVILPAHYVIGHNTTSKDARLQPLIACYTPDRRTCKLHTSQQARMWY